MNLLKLGAAALAADGVAPFNEATTIALRDGTVLRVEEFDGAAGAAAPDDAPVEFVVHPDERRRGRGRALLDRLVAAGESRFWAHGE